MNHNVPLPRLSVRIVLQRNQIWFSELLGIIFVLALILCLSTFGAIVLLNESRIRNNNRTIAHLEIQHALLHSRFAQLRDKDVIRATLAEFSRGRLPRQSINLLVELVYESSRTYGYDPLLVLAVIHVESVFDPAALGRYRSGRFSGALGLMQLKFETAREVARDLGIELQSVEDVFVPEINIAIGVAYLTRLITRFQSLKLGILAYNQGPGIISRSIADKRPLSQRYYNKVLRSYFRLKSMHEERLRGGT